MKVTKITAETVELKSWLEKVNELYRDYIKTVHPSGEDVSKIQYVDVFSTGPKRIKIVYGTYVFAFIDRETGDIYKPATFKAPAKHVRGNLFSDENGMEAITASIGGSNSHPHIRYLR